MIGEQSEPDKFVENEHFMRQFPWQECILSKENFTWQNYWGGGARAPCAPPPGSYAHEISYGIIVEKFEIEKIQIEAGRIITGATQSCSKSKIQEETGWDSLETRRYKHRMVTFFKMVKGYAPSYLQFIVPPSVHQVSQRNLRNNQNFTVPRARTNLYNNSFIPLATREWNLLPPEAKNCNSLYSFKRFLNRNVTSILKYYYIGDRKSQISHTRLRLKCSSLNADLLKNHILDNDKCPCGQIENAEHFLLNCPIYTELRNKTIRKIALPYNIETLLKGCPLYDDNVNGEIFLAVQNFIFKSNRFE